MIVGSGSSKKSDRQAVLVLAVIVLVGAALGLRVWANQQRLEVPNFRAMTTAPDDRVFVVVGNDLYIESGSEASRRMLPLSQWGVRDFYGDLGVLADGSVILAQGRLGRAGIAEGGRLFLRQPPSASDPVERLQRCDPASGTCAALDGGDRPVEVRRAFSMAVDERSGVMYLSDPANHRVIQASLHGRQLAVSGDGWKFPNGIRVIDSGTVAFADTDNHRYVELAVSADGFGTIVAEQDVLDWPRANPLNSFPFEILVDDAGTLWMLVASSGMDDARLYRRATSGPAALLELPQDADPVALAASDGRVLVADAQHFTIHAFDAGGKRLAPFGSDRLRQQLEQYRAAHDRFEAIFDYSLVALLLVALPALVIGLILQRRGRAVETPDEPVSVGRDAEPLVASDPQAQLSQLRGEFVFWRKFSALGTREGLRFGILLGGFMLTMLGVIVMLGVEHADREGLPPGEEFDDPRLYAAVLAVSGTLAFYWLSGMYERLVVTRDGIRYRSFLNGPLRPLNALHPDWFITWTNVQNIRLAYGGDGSRPFHWYYELILLSGGRRKLKPFSWRLAGEHEVGVRLRDATRLRRGVLRQAIAGTFLYRLLGRQRVSEPAAPGLHEPG